VGLDNMLNTIPATLVCLKINDVNLTVDGFKTVVSKLEEIKELRELALEN